MKKILSVLIAALCVSMLFSGCGKEAEEPVSTGTETTTRSTKFDKPDWSFISKSGVDENSLLEKVNDENVSLVADYVQDIIDKEKENNSKITDDEIYAAAFENAQYKELIKLGDRAELALYWMIYRNPEGDLYEHICAAALSELTGLKFDNKWSTAGEYLELFNGYYAGK